MSGLRSLAAQADLRVEGLIDGDGTQRFIRLVGVLHDAAARAGVRSLPGPFQLTPKVGGAMAGARHLMGSMAAQGIIPSPS